MVRRSYWRSDMTPREFAVEVVRRLRLAGYEAYWAGGCVRDELLGREPKDYDVATSALPDEVRRLFGKERTLTVGASFGVVVVVGPRSAGTIDVATFRQDTTYSDGRHPDAVVFASAREDALRRDFTINGLFYDPIDERVIDFVGGQEDLKKGVIRAIGDADQRIAEDKLRMLRAIRFATIFGFTIDEACWNAIRRHAAEITQVSVERVTAELKWIVEHPERSRGVQLLWRSGLLEWILPEGVEAYGWHRPEGPLPCWGETLAILAALGTQPDATIALAVLLRYVCGVKASRPVSVHEISRRWRLSSKEAELLDRSLRHEELLLQADRRPWPEVQRVLASAQAERLLEYAAAISQVTGVGSESIALCRRTLALPRECWDPPPVLCGDDLKKLGLPPGPAYRTILDAVRDAQLEGRIRSQEEAIQMARRLAGIDEPDSTSPK